MPWLLLAGAAACAALLVAILLGDTEPVFEGDRAAAVAWAAIALAALGSLGWWRDRRRVRAAAAGEAAGREAAEAARRDAEAARREAEEAEARAHAERLAAQRARDWERRLREEVLELRAKGGPFGHLHDLRALVLRLAVELTGAERGLLLVRDADGDGRLDVAAAEGVPEDDPDVGPVVDRFARESLRRDEIRRDDDLLAIPVYVQDELHGVVVCSGRPGGFDDLDDEVLLALGDQAGATLANGRLHGELRDALHGTVAVLAGAIEAKDPALRGHSDDVVRYVDAVAERLGLERDRREELLVGSLLHDVGKIGISEGILLKPAALTEEERAIIELHPRIGFRLLEEVPALRSIAPAVLHHHERWAGGGYPAGLRGEQIPLEARIVAVADAFAAMTCDRPYQRRRTADEACAELERCAGDQFDPQVVSAFVEAVRADPPRTDRPAWSRALDDPELAALRAEGEAVLGRRPQALTDPVTLLYGRRYLEEAAASAAWASGQHGRPFGAVVLELPGLRRVNEEAGYAAGDALLREAAGALQHRAAQLGATAARDGGDRLALLVPDAGEESVAVLGRELAADGVLRAAWAAWRPGESGPDVLARARDGLRVP